MRALQIAILALAGLMPLTLRAEKPQMTWMLPDFSPASIPENGKPGHGHVDEMVKLLIEHWPESAEHNFVMANSKRVWKMIEEGQNICHAAALHTPEREKIAYFTDSNLLPPLHVIVRKNLVGKLPRNAAGEVLLPKLLALPLAGLIPEKRSFGNKVDEMIAKRPATSGLSMTAPSDFGGRMLSMMALGRIDYTLDYDFALGYQQSLNPELRGLVALPIAGNTAPVLGGVACPKTDWGRTAIQRVDAILSANAQSPKLRQSFERWLTPETRKRYAPLLNAFYRQRAIPTAPEKFR